MGQDRLSSLAVIQINVSEICKISISAIIDIFASSKKRRVDFY